jgi:hypothetical protein
MSQEYDFYDRAARLVQQALEANLQDAGIREWLRREPRLQERGCEEILQRSEQKAYLSEPDIYNDILDLAVARVALYFPAGGQQAETAIKNLFHLSQSPIKFPKENRSDRSVPPMPSGFQDIGQHTIGSIFEHKI